MVRWLKFSLKTPTIIHSFIWVLTSFGWAGFDNRVGNALLSPCDQCCLLGRGWLDLDVIGWGVGTRAGSQGGGTADRAQYGDTVRGLDRKCCHLGQVSSSWGIGGSLKGKVSPMKKKGKQAHRPNHLTSLDNATHPRKSYVLSSKTVGVYLTVRPQGEIFLLFWEL